MTEGPLVRYEAAERMLAEIQTMDDADHVMRLAEAARVFAERERLGVAMVNHATAIKLKAGNRLIAIHEESKRPVGQPSKSIVETRYNTSPITNQQAARLRKAAIAAPTDADIDRLANDATKSGKPLSLDSLVKSGTRKVREAKLRADRAAAETEARAKIAELPAAPEIVRADLREWRPAGVGAIITDPPYVGDSIPLHEALRDFAVDVLPEGAALVVMTWQAILPGVIRALEHPELAYRWTICWRYANAANTVDHARRVFDCWKPVLVYHKGAMPKDAPTMRDEIANMAGDKDYHEWGQSVEGFERLVKTFSAAGDIVCDPFVGGGTTAVAALRHARRFAGCDTDAEAVRITQERLAA